MALSYRALLGWPLYSDLSTLDASEGLWRGPPTDVSYAGLPLANIQDRRLAKVARSWSADARDTCIRIDMGQNRYVAVVAIPQHTLTQQGAMRAVGSPAFAVQGAGAGVLMEYVAGDDIEAKGGVFTRTPVVGDLAPPTYRTREGYVRYAGENRCLRSAEFDNASWVKTTVTVAADSVQSPDTAESLAKADTLTASAGNGTVIQDLGVYATASDWVFSVWLRRKTGTGSIELTLDNGSTWTTVTVTDEWKRLSIAQNVASPDCGIRIVTNADAVYAWGAQAELRPGATTLGGAYALPTAYLATTSALRGAARDNHHVAGHTYRTLLIERAQTNIALRAQQFDNASWVKTRSSVTADADTAPDGTLSADRLVEDTTASNTHSMAQSGLTITADADVCFSVWAKTGPTVRRLYLKVQDGTNTNTVARRYDLVAGTDAGSAGVAGTGAYVASGIETMAGGWYRCWLACNIGSADTSLMVEIFLDNGSAVSYTGDGVSYLSLWGAQFEQARHPSSYIYTITATAARPAEFLSLPVANAAVPGALSAYVHFIEMAQPNWVTDVGGEPRIYQIGTNGTTNNKTLRLIKSSATDNYQLVHTNVVTASVSSNADVNPVYSSRVEVLGTMTAAGAVTASARKDGGTVVVGSTSATQAVDAAWTAQNVYIGASSLGSGTGDIAVIAMRILDGVQTLATCADAVYDSGWVTTDPTVYPAGSLEAGDPRLVTGKMTAEEYAELPTPLVHVLDPWFTGRYWRVQVDDEYNAAGYVDLARVVVCGATQPSHNMSVGARLGWETATQRIELDGGATLYVPRPRRRVALFQWDDLPEAEALAGLYDLQRRLGTHGQLMFVYAPNDVTHRMRRSFLCVLRELTPLTTPFADGRLSVPFALVEEL